MPMQENLSINRNNLDIVCFSLSRWDAEISSPAVSLAREFAKNHRVFFIGHPYSYKDIFLGNRNTTKQHSAIPKNVKVITPPPVYPVNFLPPGKIYNWFASINHSILLRLLRKVIRENNIGSYIFINFFDPFFLSNIPADIGPEKYVYQCMDDMSQVEYTRRHGVSLENEIIRKADLVLCTSQQLTRMKSAFSNHVHFHPNAADFDLFNQAAQDKFSRPADMDFGNKKIIGFAGSIEYRTDFNLLKKIALHHHDKILLLIGPVQGTEHVEAGIDKLPNVIFAGARKIENLPAYVQYFDCAIIPYKKNVLTASIYPLKINEYLAAGKPVVTTAFSEDILSFAPHAYVAKTDEEFLTAIDEVISSNDIHKKTMRVKAASSNSWAKRVEEFWKLLG